MSAETRPRVPGARAALTTRRKDAVRSKSSFVQRSCEYFSRIGFNRCMNSAACLFVAALRCGFTGTGEDFCGPDGTGEVGACGPDGAGEVGICGPDGAGEVGCCGPDGIGPGLPVCGFTAPPFCGPADGAIN